MGTDHDRRRPVLLAPAGANGSVAHAARLSPAVGEVSGWPLLPCRIWPSSAVVVGLVLICTLVGLWSTSSSLCSCSDKLLRSWSAYSGGATDSVLDVLGFQLGLVGVH